MIVKFDIEEIKNAVKALSGVCSRKSSDDKSRFVSIKCGLSRAKLITSGEYCDIELAISCDAQSDVEFTVYFDDLKSLVLSSSEIVFKIGTHIEVLNGRSKFKLNQIEFSHFVEFEEMHAYHIVESNALLHLINCAKVIPDLKRIDQNIPTDSIRFNMQDSDLYVWSCCSAGAFKGRCDTLPQGPANKPNSAIVKAALLAPMTQFFSGQDAEISIWADKNACHFWSGNFRIKIRQSFGAFPKMLEGIFQKEAEFTASFYAESGPLRGCISDVLMFANDVDGVSFEPQKKQLLIRSSGEMGNTVSKLEIQLKGSNKKPDFKLRGSIVSRSSALLGGKMMIKFIDNNTPVFFSRENQTFAIMVYGDTK